MLTHVVKLASWLAIAIPATSALSHRAQEMLTQSMNWMDDFYDSDAGYLYDFSAAVALNHDTRNSAWYAVGLLARNGNDGDDTTQAQRIIANVVAGQYKIPREQWFGTYTKEPEEPYVGSPHYEAELYGSWDPNWRGFVGTTFIVIMEEFGDLLSDCTKDLVMQSLRNATIGDSYRVGGVDGDNLYPSYSNPAIMRAFVAGWTGRKLNEQKMIDDGEKYAREIIDLFNQHRTLSEFNSGTYTGVSLFGLTLWSKYLPADSVMTKNGPAMLGDTWGAVTQLWHPLMKNMAGPWDRAYGYDMNRYLSLMALWFWLFIGKENSSLIAKSQVMSHSADFAWAPIFAVLADKHESLLPKGTVMSLETFGGDRIFEAQASYPPYDLAPRTIKTWLSENLTIGAESFQETNVGGPAENQEAFNPAVAQWAYGSDIGFLSLYPTEPSLVATVNPGQLTLSYPVWNSSSIFTFMVSTSRRMRTVSTWDDIQGAKIAVTGNVNMAYELSFGGNLGGANKPLRDFDLWNFTYSVPSSFTGTPTVTLNFAV